MLGETLKTNARKGDNHQELYHHADESGQSESEQEEEEEEPDSPLESLYPQQGDPGMTPTSRAPQRGRSSHSQGSSGLLLCHMLL